MGLFNRFYKSILNNLSAFHFFLRTGLRRSKVLETYKGLCNRYLTLGNPGEVRVYGALYEIVTVTPRMKVVLWLKGHSTIFWFDRDSLQVIPDRSDQTEGLNLWDPEAFHVLQLFRQLNKTGIRIPFNNEGVTYFRMPGEELIDA